MRTVFTGKSLGGACAPAGALLKAHNSAQTTPGVFWCGLIGIRRRYRGFSNVTK
jgi:hypothetical protein